MVAIRAAYLLTVICHLLALSKPSLAVTSKFDQCLADVRSGKFGPDVGLNNKGQPIKNVSEATAISYPTCVRACGPGPDHFDWDIFSTQFSSWLLPWLALLSQLPFGANDSVENLLSMALMVGSPMLAAFALAITVLNKRWLVQRFASFHFPHTKNAVIALSDLQQAPFIVTADLQLLTSLVMLPQNEGWWNDLHVRMGEGYLWNMAAGASIIWTVISYIFTTIGSFQNSDDVSKSIPSHGRGIGAVWFWLLPVVVGWLQLSPKSDLNKLRNALVHAHEKVFMITKNGEIVPASTDEFAKEIPAIFFPDGRDNRDLDHALCRDRYCTAPLYNYARCFSWADSIESIALAYDLASRRLQRAKMSSMESQDSDLEKEDYEEHMQHLAHVVAAVSKIEDEVETIRERRWAPQVWSRIAFALLLALLLQWGTTGAAVMVNYYTMTYGIGCRVLSEILYGCASVLACILLVLSVIFAHLASNSSSLDSAQYANGKPFKPSRTTTFLRHTSIALRKAGKLLALLNALFILLVCIFQFSNFFDRCWCNSSWIQRRDKAYNVLAPTMDDLKEMRNKWIPGLALAAVVAGLYLGLLNLISPRIKR